MEWRTDAKKVIIILGDAAPLDPEPVTNYTYDDVLLALFNADISIDVEGSDDRVVDALDTSLINVFSIGTGASDDAADFFEEIAVSTGGSYADVDDASEVSDAIIDSIEQIEVVELVTVSADFGDAMANEKIDLYSGGEYLFTLQTDERGHFKIEAIEPNTYTWTSNSLYSSGSLEIESGSRDADIQVHTAYWFAPLLQLWQQYSLLFCAALAAFLMVCIAVPFAIRRIRRHVRTSGSASPSGHGSKASPAPGAESILHCPNCGSPADPDGSFCGSCGCNLKTAFSEPAKPVCPVCGADLVEGCAYCGQCGAKNETR